VLKGTIRLSLLIALLMNSDIGVKAWTAAAASGTAGRSGQSSQARVQVRKTAHVPSPTEKRRTMCTASRVPDQGKRSASRSWTTKLTLSRSNVISPARACGLGWRTTSISLVSIQNVSAAPIA